MVKKELAVSFVLLLLLPAVSPLWAHAGVRHGEGLEMHPRLEVLTVGPDQRFQVTLAHLPDAPWTGENVQFLIRLEESLAIDDPLLGGQTPFLPQALRVWVEEEDGSSYSLEIKEEAEAGVYRFDHAFPRPGEWKLLFEFEDENGVKSGGELMIPLEAQPIYWSLLLFQGMLVLASIGLVVQRFRTSPAGSSVLYSLIVFSIGGATLLLVNSFWASGEIGVLEVEALTSLESEPSGSGDFYQSPSELLQEPQFVSSTRMFSGTVRHATNRITQVRSPLPGTVVFQSGVPKIGDWVRKGQVLGVVEDQFNVHDYSHLLNQRWELLKMVMEASEIKVQAEAAYQRAASLLDLGVISRREYERKELEFNQANTAQEKAQERLNLHDTQLRRNDLHETQLVSPITGYISLATYSAGQMIYEDDPIFEIVDPSVVWVEVFALPQDMGKVRNQSEVTLRSSALKQTFSGKLVEIRPDVEAESKALRVLYEVQNPELWLKPGMLVDVYPQAAPQQAQTHQVTTEAGN
ncbi:HlyD family efflux transporter periplasmic adaptor subunit [Acidobacteria bacterium AH-259-D05]|nr:HlyD family efflux transporter periplasmic adaptor subunit [Acidobacteria bacterium AH-259-D05]